MKRVVEEYLGADTANSFAQTEGTVNSELDSLREHLRSIDPTLSEAREYADRCAEFFEARC